jgi:hypothetical protein
MGNFKQNLYRMLNCLLIFFNEPPQDAGALYYLFYKPLENDHPTRRKIQQKANTEAEPCAFSVTLTDIVCGALPNQPPNNDSTGKLKQGILTIKRKNPKDLNVDYICRLCSR